ncbi:MAG TPA: ATP-binding protein [Candidatus Didemnitutus sp.]|nr:ATP-binding protein [Candidatus Didemnitutus sp.]
MNTRSLRFRLVSSYAMWLVAVLALAGGLLYFGLHQYLEANLGATELRRAARIALLVQRSPVTPGRDLAGEITADFAPEASGRFVRVSRPDGTVIYQSARPGDGSFDAGQVTSGPHSAGARKERQRDGTEMMIATVALGPADHPALLVETGESLASALAELRRLLFSLAMGFSVVAALALAGGLVLVRRALQPVLDITRSAERITSHNLSDRLPVPPTGDEIAHLTHALNRMIGRLDDTFQYNRRFLADASHELRTPLTILRGELETMVAAESLDPATRETVGNLLDEVARLARIVENLFSLSRFDAGQTEKDPERFDLAKLVTTTSEQMCLLAEDKGLTIECEAREPVPVEGDRAWLKQVVVNLLDNAIKYTQPGGRVRLSVARRADEALFEVADTGVGIPPEALPRVFDRFFRVDVARSREVGGAGIGLSIVKAICTAHQGRVDVESEPGAGSRFRVHLPLAADAGLKSS